MLVETFYHLKPYIPRRMQIALRRRLAAYRRYQARGQWPIGEQLSTPPPGWPGWPDGKKFALVLTHDVELDYGVSQCDRLAALEEERGFRSTFAFVPQRYRTPDRLRQGLVERGFSIMVHDLNHDGKLFLTREIFEQRKPLIDDFLASWNTRGFASGAALHNLSWISELDIDYSISTYDWDPFEPQGCSLGRIFPLWVQDPKSERGFVELPYSLCQDFTLFILLGEQTTQLWREKLDWIAQHGGMALIKTHPDYMFFQQDQRAADRYPARLYAEFLDYVNANYRDVAWLAKPSEVASYWRELGGLHSTNAPEIPSRETFCTTCRQAYNESWLQQYPAFSLSTSST